MMRGVGLAEEVSGLHDSLMCSERDNAMQVSEKGINLLQNIV